MSAFQDIFGAYDQTPEPVVTLGDEPITKKGWNESLLMV